MTPAPDRIRADVARTLESNGIAPRRAMKAAVRLVRGLSLADRTTDSDPCETLYNMRDRIAELLQDRGVPEAAAEAVARRIIDWLRKQWGGRTLTVRWWGFANTGEQTDTDELFTTHADPVKSVKGRELRVVVWGILFHHPSSLISHPCFVASEIAALVEQEWATIYVPKGEDIDRQARDYEIFKQFGGLGSIDKMKPMGMSQSRYYEVFKRVKSEREKREQPGLF